MAPLQPQSMSATGPGRGCPAGWNFRSGAMAAGHAKSRTQRSPSPRCSPRREVLAGGGWHRRPPFFPANSPGFMRSLRAGRAPPVMMVTINGEYASTAKNMPKNFLIALTLSGGGRLCKIRPNPDPINGGNKRGLFFAKEKRCVSFYIAA